MTSLLVNTCGGSLDEVAIEVFKMIEKLKSSSTSGVGEIEISIYMSREFWVNCMGEVVGAVRPFMFDFYNSHCDPEREHQLLGNPVYVVDGDSHPDCVIYGRLVGLMAKPLPLRKRG